MKKGLRTYYTELSFDILHQLEEKILTWKRMKRFMSSILMLKQILLRKIKMDAIKEPLHGSALLQESEVQLIKFFKKKYFQQNSELKVLIIRGKDVAMPRISTIKQIDPFLNGNGIIFFWSQLKGSFLNKLDKHPVIFPKGE